MLDKSFNFKDVEPRVYAQWEESGAFRAGRRPDAQAFCIVIPPPNVTGRLHVGHALNNTLQDVLARFERMRGKDVLWQPGMDHAGIATQLVVERQLAERQQSRVAMGREKFLEEVWRWKEESGGAIGQQLRRLGASADWSRERFTMDEGLSRAVLKVFVELYREGLIYKDKRLVNWDPRLQTAVSDLEVENIEMKGHLWYLRYPIEGKSFDPNDTSTFVAVATSRPETMLGDTAVAVHPADERYRHLVESKAMVRLPLADRLIPIIADEHSDPEKGTGVVKITPGHDFNDFEVGKRHDLELRNILNKDGTLNDTVPEGYRGLDRFAARKRIVADLEEQELLQKIEPITHAVPHDEKTKTVVLEPLLTEQWYLNVAPLAEKAVKAVEDGRTHIVPDQWQTVYFNWLRNIHPWCISRQLWWGHQIPVWYAPRLPGKELAGPSGSQFFYEGAETQGGLTLNFFVAESEDEALEQARAFYKDDNVSVSVAKNAREGGDAYTAFREGRGTEIKIWRDPDVLDTWFSSALWPFSTLGWPDKTPELARYYPTSVLVTAFDIIFFWVARMMMMGLHFMKEVPFPDVYIHALVRDEKGAKMSKSKGNVVDPLGVIDQYGADALRFTLARNVAPGHDIRLGPQDVENNRNFATKLWNAARFAEFNGAARVEGFDPKSAKETLNRWIAHETAKAAAEITQAIEAYAFNEAAGAAYRFVWNVYCDWYVELSKPLLTGPDGAAKDETRAMAAWALDEILKVLHPFMPFITEELWAVTAEQGPKRSQVLALSHWPKLNGLTDAAAEAEIGWVIDLVTAIRSIRAEMNITAQIPLVLAGASAETKARAARWAEFIQRLARISEISSAASAPAGSVQLVVRGEVAALPLKGVIDLAAERARLAKEMQKAQADIARVDAKLSNANFVARAPEEVVEEEKEKRAEAAARQTKIAEALARLKDAE
jgi:valyl-tRNA synthetase